MTEREPRPPRRGLPFGERRGPTANGAPPAATSWREGSPPILQEHRGSLADAEADAAYRWALPAVGGRDVLDVGCGAGHGIAMVLDAGARSALGADHDSRSVEIATRLHGDRARFIAAEPLALPLSPRSFGAITCFEELERGPDPIALLESLSRLLSHDGILLVSLPTTPRRDEISGVPLGQVVAAEEWEARLAATYENVSSHRRRLGFAATVIGSEQSPELQSVSWLGADPCEDRSLLIAASNGELPDFPALATIAGSRDLRAYRETISAWEQRARAAEADGSAKHWELVASREAQRRLRKRLHDLEHRPLRRLWRIVRGRPSQLGPGPPLRASERPPEPWD